MIDQVLIKEGGYIIGRTPVPFFIPSNATVSEHKVEIGRLSLALFPLSAQLAHSLRVFKRLFKSRCPDVLLSLRRSGAD